MAEETENKSLEHTVEQDDKSSSSDKPKSNKLIFVFLVLVIVTFSATFFYGNKRLVELKQEVSQIESSGGVLINDLDDRIKNTTSQFSEIKRKLDEIESKQLVMENLIPESIAQPVRINEEFALAEIEHLLIIASYRLQLNHDVATALSAMEAADMRLKGLHDPNILEVREQLIADMNELRSLNQADLSGLGLFLSDLINRVDTLPLKEEMVLNVSEHDAYSKEEKEPVNGISRFFLLVWQELKSLIVITRDEQVSKVRLLPDETYYLRANIKLELANARFAVFNRDTNNFRASVEHIQTWLNDYFDQSDAAVRNIYDSLTRMSKIELAFPEIDISSSLESVRALIRYQSESSDISEQELTPIQ